MGVAAARFLLLTSVSLSVALSAPAGAGPCSLESAKTASVRTSALNLARVEIGIFEPLTKVLNPELVEETRLQTRPIASPVGGTVSFDRISREALLALSKAKLDPQKLSAPDLLKLTSDPLRAQAGRKDVAAVPSKPWPAATQRATADNASPFYIVGEDGTRDIPKYPEITGIPDPKLCRARPGRLFDPSCFFGIPSPQIYPVGEPAVALGQRRTAVASLATVLIRVVSDDGRVQICTGSHLGGGVLLTAHHCYRNESFVAKDFVVYFNTDVLAPPFPPGLAAKPVNAGDASSESLDFLLLKVTDLPDKFAGAFLKLAARDPWTGCGDGSDLEAYVAWHESETRIAKRYSGDKQCVTKRNAQCFGRTGRRVHGCDTTENSSGAPVLLRGGNSIVAVHTNGRMEDDSNCALPTAEIRKAIMNENGQPKWPEIANVLWEE